jgi:hypothetical protein
MLRLSLASTETKREKWRRSWMLIKLIQSIVDLGCAFLGFRILLQFPLGDAVFPWGLPLYSALIRFLINQRALWEVKDDIYFVLSHPISLSLFNVIPLALSTGTKTYVARRLGDLPLLRLGFRLALCSDFIGICLTLYSVHYWRNVEPRTFYGPTRLHIKYPEEPPAESSRVCPGPLEMLYRQQTIQRSGRAQIDALSRLDNATRGSKGSKVSKVTTEKPQTTHKGTETVVSKLRLVQGSSGATEVPAPQDLGQVQVHNAHNLSRGGHQLQAGGLRHSVRFDPLIFCTGSPEDFMYWCIVNIAANIGMLLLAAYTVWDMDEFDYQYSWSVLELSANSTY